MNKVKLVKSEFIFPIIKEILDSGRCARITVTGMSMYPFLRENIDSVEISYTSFDNICRSDIVMILRDSGEYVLHRVIKKCRDYFYIVGDSQQTIEGPLRPDQLIGVTKAVWRGNKRIECQSFRWKLLTLTWLHLLPFRGVIIKCYSKMLSLIDLLADPRLNNNSQ